MDVLSSIVGMLSPLSIPLGSVATRKQQFAKVEPMSKYVTNKILTGNLDEHPATIRWRQLTSQPCVPKVIVVMKERRQDKPGKSAVYRLEGAGPSGVAIVAKRCRRAIAQLEHTIYTEILPYLPIPNLACYGVIDEPNAEFCWIFLEDAGDIPFTATSREQRLAAEYYLGRLHSSAAGITALMHLPDRGPDHYREHLRSAYDTLLSLFPTQTSTRGDRLVVHALREQCEFLELHWDRIKQICMHMPQTLVHGDFVEKNVRVRKEQNRIVLLPFDWESAGRGAPAADLALFRNGSASSPTLGYWSAVKEVWPHVTVVEMREWSAIGSLFRWLAALDWASIGSIPEYPAGTAAKKLGIYQSSVAALIESIGWTS
jgi:hypothetical protein